MAVLLGAYPPKVRALLLEILTERDDAERARRIGEFHADERSRGFAELLIDLEEDSAARAFVAMTPREPALVAEARATLRTSFASDPGWERLRSGIVASLDRLRAQAHKQAREAGVDPG